MNKLVLFTLCVLATSAATTLANPRRLTWWEDMAGAAYSGIQAIESNVNDAVQDAAAWSQAHTNGGRRLYWWNDVASAVSGAASSALSSAGDMVMSAGSQLWNSLSSSASDALQSAQDQLHQLTTRQMNYAQHKLETMKALLTEQGNTINANLQAQFQETCSDIEDQANALIQNGRGQAQHLFESAVNTLENRVNDLVAGRTLRSRRGRRLNWLTSAWSTVSNAAHQVADAAGDAWDTVRGMYGNQIQTSFEAIEEAAKNLGEDVKGELKTKMDAWKPKFQNMLAKTSDSAKEFVATHLPEVQQYLQEVATHVGTAGKTQLDNAVKDIEGIIDQIDAGVRMRVRL